MPLVFLGYDKDEAGHLVINEGAGESGADRIFREFLEGNSHLKITQTLNTENVSGVLAKSLGWFRSFASLK